MVSLQPVLFIISNIFIFSYILTIYYKYRTALLHIQAAITTYIYGTYTYMYTYEVKLVVLQFLLYRFHLSFMYVILACI